jgi:hypothetical protein
MHLDIPLVRDPWIAVPTADNAGLAGQADCGRALVRASSDNHLREKYPPETAPK